MRMEFTRGYHGGCCWYSKSKHLCTYLKLQKSTWMFHSATGNIICGLEKTGEKWANITSKLHPSGHHGLELLWCLRACIACYHMQKNLFSTFFKDVCRGMLAHLFANWSSTEVGWCNRSNQQQNGISRGKYAFWCGPWSQESASHQTSEKYCWTQTVL